MAAAAITPLVVDPAGVAVSLAAVAAGDGVYFPNPSDQRTYLEVANGGGGSITVTVAPVDGSARVPGVGLVAVPTIAVAVAAGARKKIGPFTAAYTRADGTVLATFSGVTSVTAAAFSVPRQT